MTTRAGRDRFTPEQCRQIATALKMGVGAKVDQPTYRVVIAELSAHFVLYCAGFSPIAFYRAAGIAHPESLEHGFSDEKTGGA